MKQFKTVSIKKILQTTLGKTKSEKFLKGIDFTDMAAMTENNTASSSVNIYQGALAKLLDGEMEKAINYIIYGLDLDRDSKLLFNLCKNMVFTLSKQVEGNVSELLKNTVNIKNTENLDKDRNFFRNKIKDLEKIVTNENTKLEKMESELYNSRPSFFSVNKLFIPYQLKKKKLKPQIKLLKDTIGNFITELDSYRSELRELEKHTKIEEYLKVLGLTLEICIFPTRFNTQV
jgi:chaperonin cofactor prefoldin